MRWLAHQAAGTLRRRGGDLKLKDPPREQRLGRAVGSQTPGQADSKRDRSSGVAVGIGNSGRNGRRVVGVSVAVSRGAGVGVAVGAGVGVAIAVGDGDGVSVGTSGRGRRRSGRGGCIVAVGAGSAPAAARRGHRSQQ